MRRGTKLSYLFSGFLLIFSALLGFPLSSCVGISEPVSNKTPISQTALERGERSYQIQPGDSLTINVWRVPLLTQEVTVGPDGTFLYPLLGSVPAQGKTIDEVRDYLTKELGKDYLANPVITVGRGSESRGFFVVGEVKNPGGFPLKEKISVYKAIITAGGFTDFASKSVKIIRRKGGQRQVFKFNIKKFEKEGKVDPNADIQPGDIVVVPKRLL